MNTSHRKEDGISREKALDLVSSLIAEKNASSILRAWPALFFLAGPFLPWRHWATENQSLLGACIWTALFVAFSSAFRMNFYAKRLAAIAKVLEGSGVIETYRKGAGETIGGDSAGARAP